MNLSPMTRCWFLTREDLFNLWFWCWVAFSMSISWIDSKLSLYDWAGGLCVMWAVCVVAGADEGRQAVIAWLAVDDNSGCDTSAQNSSSGYRSVRVKFIVSLPWIGGTLSDDVGDDPGEWRDLARCELIYDQQQSYIKMRRVYLKYLKSHEIHFRFNVGLNFKCHSLIGEKIHTVSPPCKHPYF